VFHSSESFANSSQLCVQALLSVRHRICCCVWQQSVAVFNKHWKHKLKTVSITVCKKTLPLKLHSDIIVMSSWYFVVVEINEDSLAEN